jgi:hypothetical protein
MKENDMEENVTDAQKETPIRIDYDNVDVADIMDQIKRRIAQRPPAPAGAPAAAGEGPSGVVPAAPGGGEGLAMRVLRMLTRPFMPIVRPLLDRFIIRVNMDVNVRIDQMNDRFNTRIDEMSGSLNMRIAEVSRRLNTTQENTKLLHTLGHNLVLELTKLKIEHEALKSKVRIMEKDFEVLGKRERVLEKKVMG